MRYISGAAIVVCTVSAATGAAFALFGMIPPPPKAVAVITPQSAAHSAVLHFNLFIDLSKFRYPLTAVKVMLSIKSFCPAIKSVKGSSVIIVHAAIKRCVLLCIPLSLV